MKKKTIFETLHIDSNDFNQVVDILQKMETGVDLKTKGKQITKLDIKKKDYCFALFVSKMLEESATRTTMEFYLETPKLSQGALKDIKIMKDALIYINAFLQGTDSKDSTIKLFSVFVPVIILISSPITPLSFAVEVFVKLIKFHKFSYGEILVGLNTFLSVIDPVKEVPKQQLN